MTAPPTSPAALQHRRHCEDFTAAVAELCRNDPAARRALRQGRGRPVEDCAPLHRYLARRTAAQRSRRVHYTVASLIAGVDPLDEIRAAWPAPPRPLAGQHPEPAPPTPSPASEPDAAPADSAPMSGVGRQADGEDAAGGQGQPGHPGSGEGTAAGPEGGTGEDSLATARWRARPNLGGSLARAVHQAGFHAERTGDLLHVLLKVGEDQLQRRLPPVVGRLLRAGVVPDWPVLLDDLIEYRFQPARVALRWQDGFYLTAPDPRHGDQT